MILRLMLLPVTQLALAYSPLGNDVNYECRVHGLGLLVGTCVADGCQ